jgi:hypothetical protein
MTDKSMLDWATRAEKELIERVVSQGTQLSRVCYQRGGCFYGYAYNDEYYIVIEGSKDGWAVPEDSLMYADLKAQHEFALPKETGLYLIEHKIQGELTLSPAHYAKETNELLMLREPVIHHTSPDNVIRWLPLPKNFDDLKEQLQCI